MVRIPQVSSSILCNNCFPQSYEVAACERSPSNLEKQHLQRLVGLLVHYFQTPTDEDFTTARRAECHQCQEATMRKIMSFFMLVDITNVLMRRSIAHNPPPDLAMAFLNRMMASSHSSHEEAAFLGQGPVYTKIDNILVLAGFVSGTISEAIRDCSSWTKPGPPPVEAGLEEIDKGFQTIADACSADSSIPEDIYDERYLDLPAACQPMFDSVRTLPHPSIHLSSSAKMKPQCQNLCPFSTIPTDPKNDADSRRSNLCCACNSSTREPRSTPANA